MMVRIRTVRPAPTAPPCLTACAPAGGFCDRTSKGGDSTAASAGGQDEPFFFNASGVESSRPAARSPGPCSLHHEPPDGRQQRDRQPRQPEELRFAASPASGSFFTDDRGRSPRQSSPSHGARDYCDDVDHHHENFTHDTHDGGRSFFDAAPPAPAAGGQGRCNDWHHNARQRDEWNDDARGDDRRHGDDWYDDDRRHEHGGARHDARHEDQRDDGRQDDWHGPCEPHERQQPREPRPRLQESPTGPVHGGWQAATEVHRARQGDSGPGRHRGGGLHGSPKLTMWPNWL